MNYRSLKALVEQFLLEENLQTLNRTYGVEFEVCFSFDGLVRTIKEDPVFFKDDYTKDAFLIGDKEIWNEYLEHTGFSGWRHHYDGSILPNPSHDDYRRDVGIEIVTPVLSGQEGIQEIQKFLNYFKQLGMYVNNSCGGHVHIGAKDLLEGTKKQVANRFIIGLLTAQNFKPLLDALVEPDRRDSNWAEHVEANVPLIQKKFPYYATEEKSDLEHVQRLISMFAADKYKSINFNPLTKYGTIEFRIFEGSLDASKIAERIKFGTLFVNALAETEIDLTKHFLGYKEKLKKANEKGPRNKDVKYSLRQLLAQNKSEQRFLLSKIKGSYIANTETIIQAIENYPLFKKPVNLEDHRISILYPSSEDAQRDIRAMINFRGTNPKLVGNTLSFIPLIDPYRYRDIVETLFNDLQYGVGEHALSPEEFLAKIDPGEAAPYKASFQKYKQELDKTTA